MLYYPYQAVVKKEPSGIAVVTPEPYIDPKLSRQVFRE